MLTEEGLEDRDGDGYIEDSHGEAVLSDSAGSIGFVGGQPTCEAARPRFWTGRHTPERPMCGPCRVAGLP